MKLLLEKVYAETQPNGGKTLRDNINNLNGSVKSNRPFRPIRTNTMGSFRVEWRGGVLSR